MPRRTVRCVNARQSKGTIYFRFSDKSELEFRSRAELIEWVKERLNIGTMKALIVAKALEDAEDGTPLSACDGLRVTLDFGQPVFLTVESVQ